MVPTERPVVQTSLSSDGLAWLQARLLAAVCIFYSSSLTVSQSARAWTKRRHEDEWGANVKAERSKTLVAQVSHLILNLLSRGVALLTGAKVTCQTFKQGNI